MRRLALTPEELRSTLNDMTEGYTTSISHVADNGAFSFYSGIAGNLAEEEAGTKYDIRVNRNPDYDGVVYSYHVDYRVHTGWEDNPTSPWRWMLSIDEESKTK